VRAGPAVVIASACLLVVSALAAQGEGLLTGGNIATQLEAAQRAIAERAVALPGSDLGRTAETLGQMAEGVRKAVGKESGKRIDRIDDDDAGRALRGQAAALLSNAWITAAQGCSEADATAMAGALATAVEALAAAKNSGKDAQPAIQTVLAADNRPLFAVHADARDVKLVLSGVNLHDAGCDDPKLVATDLAGVPLSAQPTITGLTSTRIELSLPPGLTPGPYLLRLKPLKKGRFLGCAAQPEAVAALAVVPPPKWNVRYSITPSCRSGKGAKAVEAAQAAVAGALPELAAFGATVVQAVQLPACDDPVSYTISATARFADGSEASVGPITQSAAAGITAGIRGGIALTWDPQVRQIFASVSGGRCKGFY
jgi:hypothetical protein